MIHLPYSLPILLESLKDYFDSNSIFLLKIFIICVLIYSIITILKNCYKTILEFKAYWIMSQLLTFTDKRSEKVRMNIEKFLDFLNKPKKKKNDNK